MGDLLTRLRKPLVCAGIAAGLATTLVVTTPSNAEAFAGPLLGALAKEGAAVGGAQFSGFIGMMLGEEAGGWVDKAFTMVPDQPAYDPVGDWTKDQASKMWGYINGIFAPNQDITIPFAESPDMWDVNSSVWNGVPENSFTDTRNKPSDVVSGPASSTFTVSGLTFNSNSGLRRAVSYNFAPLTPFSTAALGFKGFGVGRVQYQCSGTGSNAGQVQKGSSDFMTPAMRNVTLNPEQTGTGTRTICASGFALDWVQIEPPSAEQVDALNASPPDPSGKYSQVTNTEILYAPDYVPQDQGYRTRVTCVNPATGQESYLWYTTPIGAGALVIPSCREAGVGTFAREIATDFVEGGTVRRPMIKTRPKEDPLVGDTQWTDCDPMFGPVCVMEIYVDGKKCTMLAPACVDWLMRHSANATGVECRYGGRVVHISYCYGLEMKYRGHPVAQDPKNFDGNPLTNNPDAPTQPEVDPEKNPNYDPNDAPLENPSDDPTEWKVPLPSPNLPEWETEKDLDPPKDPGPSDPPVDGEPPVGDQPPVVDNPPLAPPGTNTSCWGAKASWNPIEWVYQPVVCALRAAFAPTKPIATRVSSMSSKFSDRVPMSWFGIGTEGISGGSCPTSWKVTYRGESHSLICGTAADGAIRSFRPVMGAMLVIAALFPLLRSLFYSTIPLFRVTPS